MAGQHGSPSWKRFHIVLIPGFGGFDALGQVEYYSGITRVFQTWKADTPAVLHYFDNLPSAAVVTRAARLRSYLAKRIARGEILKGDGIILVGHSTGGLDIRQLVSDLHEPANNPVPVDGGILVDARRIRECVRRVVFLSVPHWGTNIADFVHSHPVWRTAVIADLRAAVAGSQVYLIDEIEERIAGRAARLTGADLLRAMQDALTEANERYGKRSPARTADAHEAASELGLYLRDMASNFYVINDLTSRRPKRGPQSPAHFNDAEREKELEQWDHPKIETRSYATLASRPFRFVPGRPAPAWDLANPFTYPEIAKDRKLSAGTDIAYRFCYRACAGGPFQRPSHCGKVTRCLSGSPPPPIELWDNDGIVNTASMLWPRGEIMLVDGDHLDIVGHYRLIKAVPGEGRRYQSYDSLKSTPRFSNAMFHEVWTEIFDFCVGRGGPKQPRIRRSRKAKREQAAMEPAGSVAVAASLPRNGG